MGTFIKFCIVIILAASLILGLLSYKAILAQCSCECGDICTSTSTTHVIEHLPYSATWEGSCCDGGPKSVSFNTLVFWHQGTQYNTLPAYVTHSWTQFDGCLPCFPEEGI